ncbi:MAG: ATP-dependent zinc metalloprotease FtsH [Lachnospiraceae bacterium]|nr:ATP-dependent zinc metalloprotease FtsH [Lachnospiraceae bacterium]
MSQNQNNRRRGGNNGPGNGPGSQNFGQNIVILLIVAAVAYFIMNYGRSMIEDRSNVEVSYDAFYEMVEKGEVDTVTIDGSTITIIPKEDSKDYSPLLHYYTIAMEDPERTQMLLSHGVVCYQEKPDTTGYLWDILIGIVLPFAAILLFMHFMSRRMGGGGGIMGVGKSNAKVYMQKDTGVTFEDVAGEDEAKESLFEIVDFLHNPAKYRTIGAKLPKGALLVGPPGTGKTLLAKAVAGEAEVPFFSLTGSDFVEMFVGVGASRVRDLFKQATAVAPCIVFIDEIDAIGKSRDSRFGGGNDEREQTLNQLLSEMDGFDPAKGIMVLGATNRPEILDPALLRPGRFDRRIIVEKPDLKGRVNILKVHARGVKLDNTVDFEEIGLATSGAVGADLANMINEAAITAVKHGRSAVSQKDLFEAVEVVLVGKEKKDRILSQEERRIVSYHEVGHALIAAVQKDAEPVQKITIVPRTMGALGYVMQVPEEEKYLNTKKELEAMIITTLGGRAAEELVFETVTTGAANDIEKATEMARAMITRYGMSEKFGLMGLAKVQDMYLSGRTVLECGDATATEVDREIMQMLAGFYEESKRILSEHMDALHKIAAHLIEKETITGKEFMEILREVEGGPEKPEAPAKEERTASSGEEQNTAAIGGQDAQASEQADVRQSAGVSVPMTEDTPQETPAKQDTAEEAKTTWEEAMAEANIKIPGRDPEDSKE